MAGSLSRALPTVLLLTAAISLAGCTPTTTPETPDSSAPVQTSSSPTASPTPTETQLPPDEGEAVGTSCDQLISAETMYEYNPNVSLTDDYSPAAGTDAATIANDYQGVTCRWVYDTSGETIDVSVAKLREDTLETLKNELVQSSNSVPTYGVEGYFDVSDGVGNGDAFTDPYWISIDSETFLEPGDATPLFEAVIASLG